VLCPLPRKSTKVHAAGHGHVSGTRFLSRHFQLTVVIAPLCLFYLYIDRASQSPLITLLPPLPGQIPWFGEGVRKCSGSSKFKIKVKTQVCYCSSRLQFFHASWKVS